MSGRRFPTAGDPSTWGAFDMNNPFDAACETERRLLLKHVQRRVTKPQCNDTALATALMMASVQLFSVVMGTEKRPFTDQQREGLREILEYCMVAGVDAWDHGETRQ